MSTSEYGRRMRTIAPLSVQLDHLVDEGDIRISATLRFAHKLGISPFLCGGPHNASDICAEHA